MCESEWVRPDPFLKYHTVLGKRFTDIKEQNKKSCYAHLLPSKGQKDSSLVTLAGDEARCKPNIGWTYLSSDTPTRL